MGKETKFNSWWYDNFVFGTGGSFNKNGFWSKRENRHFNFNCINIFLFNICCTMFKFTGLPDQLQPIDQLHFNRLLVTQGKALMYKEEGTGFYRVQAYSPAGRKNNYGYAIARKVVNTFLQRQKVYNYGDSVEIWHNPSQFPMTVFIYEYCRKLELFDEVIFNRLRLHKVPMTVNAHGEEERLAANEVLRMFEDGQDVKLRGGKRAGDFLSVEEFDVQYIIDKLLTDKQTMLSEFLTFVGINTFAFEKKERVTNDELAQNEEMVERCLSSYLITINHGLEMANKKWGLNMSCELNLDYGSALKNLMKDVSKGNGSTTHGNPPNEQEDNEEDDL